MSERRDLEKSIFLRAIEYRLPVERAVVLNEACGGDEELHAAVEALLAAHDQPQGMLDVASRVACTVDQPLLESAGAIIGQYKLLEQIGEGGFGVVFMAEQQHPVRRKVALKVVKPGMDTRQVIARFEAERQALAIMDHPNIAKVLDGGATDTGRPFFVMELIKGTPITDYCDQNHLTPRERLELLVSVCQAVQHAHQKGIVHRDLKPSNVLVIEHDTKPVVKVIDFGVAKALGQELTEKTLFTGFAQMIGTPLYMSPEQAGQSGHDIDTRSDIYSLGVLLYELLTGTTPFDKARFQQAAYDEIRRIIREEEPPKPSTRLSATDQLPSIAANRSLEPKKLSGLVRGDLDWIVMKCLEKDRSRRYETANGLAMDLHRYLHDEPVSACPPSAGYRFRKFARRNKGTLTTAILLSATMIAGTAVSIGQAVRATRAERETAKQRDTATAAEALAKENASKADKMRGVAERNEGIAQANLRTAKDNELLARRRFYAAQTNLAMHAFQTGELVRTLELLETQRPRFDEEDLRTFEWYYLWRQCYRDLELSLPLKRHASYRVAFSPDGSLVAVACPDGTVTLYDTATGLQRLTLRAGPTTWPQVAFAADGKVLAQLVTGHNHRVILWDIAAGREQTALTDIGDVRRLAVSLVGDTLAVSGSDGTVRLWDLAGGRWKATFQAFPADRTRPLGAVALAYSPDGKTLATSAIGEDFPTNLWNVGHDPPQLLRRLPSNAIASAFSPDGKTLALGNWSTVTLWKVDAESPAFHARWVWGDCYDLTFSHDGRFLASANQSKDATLVELATGKVRSFPHGASVRSVALSPDGRLLASASDDATLKFWRIADTQNPDTLPTPAWVSAVACSADSRLLATGTSEGRVHVQELATGRLTVTLGPLRYPVRVVAFSPDGRHLAAGAGDWSPGWPGNVTIWDLEGSRGPVTLAGLSSATWAVAFAPNGRMLATGSHDGNLHLWDVPSGRHIAAAKSPSRLMSLAFASESGMLVSGGNAGVVQMWESNGRELGRPVTLQQTNDETFSTWAVACSPDGRLAAAGNFDGSLRVWDLPGGRTRVAMKGHTNRIYSVAFLDEGRTLASMDEIGVLKFWDATTGQERMSVSSWDQELQHFAFAPKEQTLIVPSSSALLLLRAARDKAALALKNELDADDPTSAVGSIVAGDRFWATGRTDEARETYAEAHARLGRLAARFPNAPDYRYVQTWCELRLALLPAQEYGAAGVVALPQKLLKQIADLPDDRQSNLVRSLNDLAKSLTATERSADAERVFTLAIELVSDNATAPHNEELHRLQAEAQDLLGDGSDGRIGKVIHRQMSVTDD